MKSEHHRAKAEAIERSLAKCTVEDYETVIEGAMLAGTHWFNILLHRYGLRPFDRDAMHAEFIAPDEKRDVLAVIPEALQALEDIECFRTPYVRGDMPGGQKAAERAFECLRLLRNLARSKSSSPKEANPHATGSPD